MGLFDSTQYIFWGPSKPGTDGASKLNDTYGAGQTNLSYGMLWGLTIIGGFFALDHLYLRSPLTFVAKLLINISFMGLWYLYDVLQVTFNKDVVKLFGLSIPGYGPAGIGAGLLGAEKPDKNHTSFIIYALALFFGGIFGLDSFITGHKKTGFVRIILLISVIFAPIALIWYLMNLVKFFFNKEGLIEENYAYFGAPKPVEVEQSFIYRFLMKIPILSSIIRFIEDPIDPIKAVLSTAVEPITGAISLATEPIADAIRDGESIVQSGINLAGKVVNTAGEAITTTGEVAGKLAESVSDVTGAVTKFGEVPCAYKKTYDSVQGQAGGKLQDDLGVLPYVLMITIATVVVSGIAISYRRFRQNKGTDAKSKQDDVPPNPGAIRSDDSKEPTTTP